MSSHYMHALREGDRLNVLLDSTDGFYLQEDVTKPMIFVSVGTGFAPMRAFLWERLALQQAGVSLAEAALFNDIRSGRVDYIYGDEIERFMAEGVLDHVLKPGLVIHTIYNGYWFWGRPSFNDLWHDLRAATKEIRPDWDLSTPGLREAWNAGDYSKFHGWDRKSGEPVSAPGPGATHAP